MSGESVTLRAVRITRALLEQTTRDAFLFAYMAHNDVAPGDVEDVVYEVLEYLDRTAEEGKPHG